MSLTNSSRKVIIDSTEITIPWSLVDRDMLFFQSAPRVDNAALDDDEIQGITKLNSRLKSVFGSLDEVLRKLPNGSTIVDIGAGNGLIDILINAKFPEKKFKFILVDSNNTYPAPRLPHTFYEDEFPTYNSWFFLAKAIKLNSMNYESFVIKNPSSIWSDQQVDCVLSFSSWCWHYPVDTYIDTVNKIVKSGGYLHVNSVLNIDNALLKLSEFFKTINMESHEFIPTESAVENNRCLELIKKNNIDPAQFSFVFTGQMN